MRETQLILVEGLPGSGKSTTAHALARHLAKQNIPVRWWYEEDVDHPVYIFRDRATLQQVVDALARGEYRQVIGAALDQWRRFATAVLTSDAVVLIDGCLFGYLTWSLFPFTVPTAAIQAYVADVARIIAPAHPTLIYFYQDDISTSLARLYARRGGDTEQRFIQNATESPYGRQHDLRGFPGMVAYWTAYRQLTDAVSAELPFPMLGVETSAGDWPVYWQRVLDFLDLPRLEEWKLPESEALRFVGCYRYEQDGAHGVVTITHEGEDLLVDGLPHTWPRNRLVPVMHNTFAVESLPFELTFAEGSDGRITRMVATGRTLLNGKLPGMFIKQ